MNQTSINSSISNFRADSVTFNPHKMLTAPQQCSIFSTKHKNILNSCHSCSAQYLFQKDKFYDTQYDTGDKHIQCGRRADVLKFWLMWKAKVNVISLARQSARVKVKQVQTRIRYRFLSSGYQRSRKSRRPSIRCFKIFCKTNPKQS